MRSSKRNRIIATTLSVCALAIGIAPQQAQAFSFNIGNLASAFGYADLYTSATGLYGSASALVTEITQITNGISTTGVSGSLNILDPTKLYQQAVTTLTTATNNSSDPLNIGLEASRIQADVAAQIGTASLTQTGQALTQSQTQQQANLAAAADTAATSAGSATSSLEALQYNSAINNAMSQQLQNTTLVLTQNTQTVAAGVQVQKQISTELAQANEVKKAERSESASRITAAGNFVQPLFVQPTN
jgi:hypothetical protein